MARTWEQPTTEECRLWADQMDGEWGRLDEQMASEEDLYFQKFDVDAPGGQLVVKTGSAPSDADAATDSLVPEDVVIGVRPARDRDKYQKQADKLSRFGRGLLKAWRSKRDPLRRIANDMVIRRVGVARVMYDKDLWPDIPSGLDEDERDRWEAKHRRRCPVMLERRNPRHVRWRDNDDGEIIAVTERYRTTVLEAKLAFGRYPRSAVTLRRRDPNDTVLVTDVWVGRWRCLFLEDDPLFPVGGGSYRGVSLHGYPEIPYAVAPFRELPFDEAERRFRGMLSNAAGLYPIESQVLSMQVMMLAWNAWRTYIGWTQDGRAMDVIPGQYIPIDPRKGEYLQMLEGNPVPPELLQMAAVLDSYIQRNGVSQGPSTAEGTRSGQQLWAIQALRQLKISAAKQGLVGLVERGLYFAAQQTELLLPDTLTLPIPGKDKDGHDMGEVSIRPGDIDGYWDGWEVSFSRRLDPATIEQSKALMAFAMNNWMPLQESWKLSGLVDVPQEWEDALFRQTIQRMPFMLEMGGLELIKNYYTEDSWQYRTLAQQVQQSKMQEAAQSMLGGGPGMPPGGGGGMTPPSMNGPVNAGMGAEAGMARPPSRMNGRVQGPKLPGGGAPPGP